METTHVVWLSGGKDSTAMALRLAEVQPETDWRYVCTPTGDELPDVLLHWAKLECLLGKPLEKVTHKLDLNELIAKMNALPSWRMRWCTRMLKIETAIAWYAKNAPCVAYVGLRADEPERQGGIFGASVEQRYPMRVVGLGFGRCAEIPSRAWRGNTEAHRLRPVPLPEARRLVGIVEGIPGLLRQRGSAGG